MLAKKRFQSFFPLPAIRSPVETALYRMSQLRTEETIKVLRTVLPRPKVESQVFDETATTLHSPVLTTVTQW